ncbi:MAG: hypothetical protein V5A21_03730 [Halapricum sp.]
MRRHHLDFGRFFEVVETTDAAQAAQMTLSPGRSTGGPDNVHPDSDQWLFVHAGSGWAVINGTEYDLIVITVTIYRCDRTTPCGRSGTDLQ